MEICCIAQETINLEGCDGEGDGKEVQKRGDVGVPMADSYWGLTEKNRIV